MVLLNKNRQSQTKRPGLLNELGHSVKHIKVNRKKNNIRNTLQNKFQPMNKVVIGCLRESRKKQFSPLAQQLFQLYRPDSSMKCLPE